MAEPTFFLHMIAAVGSNGGIGLEGKLPWHCPDDLRIFKMITQNSYVIAGAATAKGLPELPSRTVVNWDGRREPSRILGYLEGAGITSAWLIGGAKTYRAFAPYVNGHRIINYIDYNGPFDTVFPFDAYGLKPPGQAFAWRSKTPGYKKFITQDQYDNYRPEYRQWYEPIHASTERVTNVKEEV